MNTTNPYIGGSFRAVDPENLTTRLSQEAKRTYRALPVASTRFMGFRTTLNYRQERCSPENP